MPNEPGFDPVAEKAGFLRTYMSGHPDTLVAYAKWFGKVPEAITSAKMSAINTRVRFLFFELSECSWASVLQRMTLMCTLKSGGVKEVDIPIEPRLRGYEDVKPRLLEMKALAQEGLGMVPVLIFCDLIKVSNCEVDKDSTYHHFQGQPWYEEW